MTSEEFGSLYQYLVVSRVWEWAIELHPNLPSATASKRGWYENDGKLSSHQAP